MNKVEIFKNERATDYNKFVENWIPNYNYFLDRLPKLLSNIENKNILIVGCGTGNEIDRFINTSNEWKLTGVDPSPEMINQARKKFQKLNNINLIEGLVSDLDINTKYNGATLLLVLHFLDDNGSKLNLLKEISNRLINGATLIILDITGDKKQIKQNLQILKLFLPDEIDEKEIDNRLNRIENELFAVSEERLSNLLLEAGFEEPIRFFQSSIYMGWITKKK